MINDKLSLCFTLKKINQLTVSKYLLHEAYWILHTNLQFKTMEIQKYYFQYVTHLHLKQVAMSKHPFVFVLRGHKPKGQELLHWGNEDLAGHEGPTHL